MIATTISTTFPGDLAEELATACAAAKEAGETALSLQAGITTTAKHDGSPVTAGDLAADAIIRHHLQARFPDDGILSEELADTSLRLQQRRVWIIDPIDGTRDYADGGDGWCVQIALAIDGRLALGVLDVPRHRHVLMGIPGQGAACATADGLRRLTATSAGDGASTMILSASHRNAVARERLVSLLPEFRLTTCTSVGVKVMHLLHGQADLYVHTRRIHEWDVAAPAAVLLGAGGSATALDGSSLNFNTPSGDCPGLVFSTRGDHQRIVERVRDVEQG